MRKLSILLFIPLFFFLSCKTNVDEISNYGKVILDKDLFRQISNLDEQNSSLDSEVVTIDLTILNSIDKQIKAAKSINTTLDNIYNNKIDDLNIGEIPFGMGYRVKVSISFNGIEIFEGISKKSFDLTSQEPNAVADIDINPIKFKIKYINDGVETPNKHADEYTFNTLITLEAPSDSTKKFLGWYDNKDFTGNPIKELGQLHTIGNVTLYPKWENIQYTITYDTGLPDKTIDSKLVNVNYVLTQEDLPIPEQNEFKFNGWFLNDESKINEGYIVKNNITLVARYRLTGKTEDVIITPVMDVSGKDTMVDQHDKISLSCDTPTSQIFYTLDGSDPITSSTKKTYNSPIDFSKDIIGKDGRVTIKAYATAPSLSESKITAATYTMKKYDVYFNNKGKGKPVPAVKGLMKGDVIPKSSLAPLTEKGYNFIHWEDINNKGTAITESYKVTSNLTLEAKWETINYKLNLDNEGDVKTSQYTVESNILLSEPEKLKIGYRFIGWYDSKDSNAKKVERINKGDTGDKTLYAKYKIIEYNINYLNSDEPSFKYNIGMTSPITLPVPQNKNGMRFDGWFRNKEFTGSAITEIPLNSHENFDLYARWTALDVTSPVTFTDAVNKNDPIELSCATPSSTIYYTTDKSDPRTSKTRIEYSAPILLVEDNYVIKAYATSPDLRDSVVTSREYNLGTYKCSFLTQFGSVPAQSVAPGSLLSSPMGLTHEGYVLEGWWYGEGETGKPWEFATDTMPNKDIELMAMWRPINYNITFNANGVSALQDKSQPYEYDTSFTMPHFNINLTGYTLKWSTQADGSGTVYELNNSYKNLCTKEGESITLYAQYKPITYNVKIITNPNAPQDAVEQPYEYGQYITLPADLELSGYRFNYEFGEIVTTETGEEIVNTYKAGYKVKNLTSESGKTVVLKALFTNIAPNSVSNVTVSQEDKKVTLNWTEPGDVDFKETVISYDNVEKVVAKGTSTIVIDQLANDKCYTFSLTSRDEGGATGKAVIVKSFANPLQTFNNSVKTLPSGTQGSYGSGGSYVEFGYWPQTIKSSTVDITDKDPIYVNGSLKAYLGNDNNYYVKSASSSNISASAKFSDGSSISASTVYYFKLEPIKWRIIPNNPEMQNGKKYVAEIALDWQLFNKTGSSYEGSYIDCYLEDTFYQQAFSYEQRKKISAFNYVTSPRKVSLLSERDINPTDFDNFASKARKATDYALSKGCVVDASGYTTWMTNTVDTGSNFKVINASGDIASQTMNGSYGVVPVINYVESQIQG